jgi:VWFA-related protein
VGSGRHFAAAWLVSALAGTGPTAQQPGPPSPPPLELPLVEQTQARLAQIDVSVSGPPEIVAALGPEDFWLKVHDRQIESFTLDRACGPAGGEGPATAASRPGRPTAYLFYFDQLHLTLAGRARAIDLARELVSRLIGEGDQAMIATSGRRLVVTQSFAGDRGELLAALDRLERDRTQWDFYANEEDDRVAAVVDRLDTLDSVQGAAGLARSYQREEQVVAERSLRRLEVALMPLCGLSVRKAVLYFGDTLRQNPGEHYLTFFGEAVQRLSPSFGDIASEAFMAGSVFDRAVNEATAHGARFYTVYARGLVTAVDSAPPSAQALARTETVPSSARTRFRDSQNTLANLASETGGQAFLRGESAPRIAESIRADQACVYTLSFDPAGLPEDDPLRVVVDLPRPEVRASVRGRIVLQSEAARRTAQLLGAFAMGGSRGELGLRAEVVPTGYEDGAYLALLQLSLPATALPAASWEVGASLIRRERVIEEVARTLAVREVGVPLVLEHALRLAPGPFELAAVARESGTGYVLSEHRRLTWPDPDGRPVTCGPLVLLQPTVGAFVRNDVTRRSGALALADSGTVLPDRPTALMGLVCRDRRRRGPLRIERSLVGDAAVDFPQLQFELDRERCAQVRDLIPAGVLGPGGYRYEMRALLEDEVAHATAHEFYVATPGP